MPKGKKFDKITQVKGTRVSHIGASPSGKATDSDSVIRVFESLRPSQKTQDTKRYPVFFRLRRMRSDSRVGAILREQNVLPYGTWAMLS